MLFFLAHAKWLRPLCPSAKHIFRKDIFGAKSSSEKRVDAYFKRHRTLGPPVAPVYRFFFLGGFPYQNKLQTKGTLILTSLLEDLVLIKWVSKPGCSLLAMVTSYEAPKWVISVLTSHLTKYPIGCLSRVLTNGFQGDVHWVILCKPLEFAKSRSSRGA